MEDPLARGRAELAQLQEALRELRKQRKLRAKEDDAELKALRDAEEMAHRELDAHRASAQELLAAQADASQRLEEAEAVVFAATAAAVLAEAVLPAPEASASPDDGSEWDEDDDDQSEAAWALRLLAADRQERIQRRQGDIAAAEAEIRRLRSLRRAPHGGGGLSSASANGASTPSSAGAGPAAEVLQWLKAEAAAVEGQLAALGMQEAASSPELVEAIVEEELQRLDGARRDLKRKLQAVESDAADDIEGHGTIIGQPAAIVRTRSASSPPSPHVPGPSLLPVPTAAGSPSGLGASKSSPSVALVPEGASAAGAGKGKGKGKAPPAPKVPPPGRPSTATAGAPATGAVAPPGPGPPKKRNNLVSLHWKVLAEPQLQAKAAAAGDALLRETAELVAAFARDPRGTEAAARWSDELRLPTRRALFDVDEDEMEDKGEEPTVFEPLVDKEEPIEEPPPTLLEAYFKRRETALRAGEAADGTRPPRGESLLDSKRLQMLGILLRKHLMAHKGETEKQAVMSIKRAVLQCEYLVLPQEALSILRTVLRQHSSEGDKITQYVQKNGEAALQELEHPHHHRLVYELMKIPQIDERLECMLFETVFEETLAKCKEDVRICCSALNVLNQKREAIKKMFATAHRLGRALNRESRAPQAERGFSLASLDKLALTKSTLSPKHSVLHFVLALMSKEDAAQVFTDEDILYLGKAKALKTHTVYQDCTELVQGFHGVREIVDTGMYTSRSTGAQVRIERRRKSLCRPAPHSSEAPLDNDDFFHDTMKDFVEEHTEDVRNIARGCYTAFQSYKDMAIWFDDLHSVYPPPANEWDTKVDLLAVLHRFAETVRTHREEVEQDGLRDLLQESQSLPDLEVARPPGWECQR